MGRRALTVDTSQEMPSVRVDPEVTPDSSQGPNLLLTAYVLCALGLFGLHDTLSFLSKRRCPSGLSNLEPSRNTATKLP